MISCPVDVNYCSSSILLTDHTLPAGTTLIKLSCVQPSSFPAWISYKVFLLRHAVDQNPCFPLQPWLLPFTLAVGGFLNAANWQRDWGTIIPPLSALPLSHQISSLSPSLSGEWTAANPSPGITGKKNNPRSNYRAKVIMWIIWVLDQVFMH